MSRKDELLCGGRFRLAQQEGVFPLSMDAMALGDFAPVAPGAEVWDLGCGSGALGLLLFGKELSLHYTGLDLDPAACALAEQNLKENSLQGKILNAGIQQIRGMVPRSCTRFIVSNPPFFPEEKGPAGSLARTGCTLQELCACAGWLLEPMGHFSLIYPARELADLLQTLRENQMEPKRLQLVAHCPSAAPRRVLVEAIRGGKPGLEVLPVLFWYMEDGEKSEDYRRIYHET